MAYTVPTTNEDGDIFDRFNDLDPQTRQNLINKYLKTKQGQDELALRGPFALAKETPEYPQNNIDFTPPIFKGPTTQQVQDYIQRNKSSKPVAIQADNRSTAQLRQGSLEPEKLEPSIDNLPLMLRNTLDSFKKQSAPISEPKYNTSTAQLRQGSLQPETVEPSIDNLPLIIRNTIDNLKKQGPSSSQPQDNRILNTISNNLKGVHFKDTPIGEFSSDVGGYLGELLGELYSNTRDHFKSLPDENSSARKKIAELANDPYSLNYKEPSEEPTPSIIASTKQPQLAKPLMAPLSEPQKQEVTAPDAANSDVEKTDNQTPQYLSPSSKAIGFPTSSPGMQLPIDKDLNEEAQIQGLNSNQVTTLRNIGIKESGGGVNNVGQPITDEMGRTPIDPVTGQPEVAMGPYQFRRATAERYKLGITPDNINMRDATRAAVQHYKYLDNLFNGDQEKVVASWFAGEGKIQQAVKQSEIANSSGKQTTWKDFIGPKTKTYLSQVSNIGTLEPSAPSPRIATQLKANLPKPPATQQSTSTVAMPINGESGVVAAPEASGVSAQKEMGITNQQDMSSPTQNTPFEQLLQRAQEAQSSKDLSYGLTRAGIQAGAAIAGVTPDYSSIDAIKTGENEIDKLKTNMAMTKANIDLQKEQDMNNPNSAISKASWNMLKSVYPDLVKQLEERGLTNLSAKQLDDMGFNISKFASATMHSRAEELKQQYRLDDKTSKSIEKYEKNANPMSVSNRLGIGREVGRLKTAQHALQLLEPYGGDLSKVSPETKMSFVYEMASTLSPTGNPRADIIDHLNVNTVNDKISQALSELFSEPISTNTPEFMKRYKGILEGQMQRAQAEITKWQDSQMLAAIRANPQAGEAVRDLRQKHNLEVFDQPITQNYGQMGSTSAVSTKTPTQSIQTGVQQDPKIAEYAKTYKMSYNQAKAIIDKRKGLK